MMGQRLTFAAIPAGRWGVSGGGWRGGQAGPFAGAHVAR